MAIRAELYKLRPSSAVQRLGKRRACLLGPRDLLRAAQAESVLLPLLCAPLPAIAAGLFSAAREARVALGLELPLQPGAAGPALYQAFEEAIDAAEEASSVIPFFLQAGPLALPADEGSAAVAQSHVFKLVDAGFTSVSVELARPSAHAAAAIARLAAPLREGELGLSLDLRRASPVDARGLQALLQELVRLGLAVQLVSTGPLQPRGAEALVSATRPAFLCPELGSAADRARLPSQELRALRLSGLWARPLRAVLSDSTWSDHEIFERREELGRLPAEAAARLEALCYVEALEAFEGLGLSGSADRVGELLAKQSGY